MYEWQSGCVSLSLSLSVWYSCDMIFMHPTIVAESDQEEKEELHTKKTKRNNSPTSWQQTNEKQLCVAQR